MIRRLLKSATANPARAARIPEGLRVFAIGDIHGRADLLRQLHRLILEDAAGNRGTTRNIVVYLGDYVDRGLESREVIELILARPLPDFETVYLKGNHEELVLRFLEDSSIGPSWFELGGDATMYSYGLRIPQGVPPEERFKDLQKELRRVVPRSHLDFLSSLELSWELGDYFFVHAGIRPGIPLEQQVPKDLLWIRNDFTTSRVDHGKLVVHGHSISEKTEIRENRIGIDTGAYATNNLTCLVLKGRSMRFLSTAEARGRRGPVEDVHRMSKRENFGLKTGSRLEPR